MNSVNFKRLLLIFVSLSGCFSVLFGAWLAHAGQLLAIEIQTRLASAQLYQFIHTLVLLALWLYLRDKHSKALMISSGLFMLGILAFSGSLYVKTFLAWPSIGKLAPLGGMLLAAAWLSLLANLVKKQK